MLFNVPSEDSCRYYGSSAFGSVCYAKFVAFGFVVGKQLASVSQLKLWTVWADAGNYVRGVVEL